MKGAVQSPGPSTPNLEPSTSDALVIAIDGPSGVGKSTVAQKVAELLSIPYLDTGAMYRCVALRWLEEGSSAELTEPTEQAILEVLESLDLELRIDDEGAHLQLSGVDVGDEIRTPQVSEQTSRLAALPAVREFMVELQQAFGHQYGGVLEGRDIGSVVFPETPYKFFLDADDSIRAERRLAQLRPQYPELTVDQVLEDLVARDRRDRERKQSPLVKTPSHILVDTGSTDADGVAQRIVQFVRSSATVG